MNENLSNSPEETQNSFDDDPQTPRRGDRTSDTDDEQVLHNNPDVMKRDDLEGLDLDADMEEDDDDLDLDPEKDDESADDTEGIR